VNSRYFFKSNIYSAHLLCFFVRVLFFTHSTTLVFTVSSIHLGLPRHAPYHLFSALRYLTLSLFFSGFFSPLSAVALTLHPFYPVFPFPHSLIRINGRRSDSLCHSVPLLRIRYRHDEGLPSFHPVSVSDILKKILSEVHGSCWWSRCQKASLVSCCRLSRP
jgi:hypothetical protein